ncbi:MAG: serine/threonine-protein kinase RsbW [Solirubrobacteraceae bacterium]|jgi:serine/threonine-protein kinase RsbW|nr:serine/threonine-protein kinase RsbW [Solirubrobacteraceae bacterium]
MSLHEPPVVTLTLPARPEGVGVVRQALVGVADGLALDGAVLSDAKVAVTEACTNAVVHAYEDEVGMLTVDMFADDAQLTVVVRDHGMGIRPQANRAGSATAALGLGLPLIAALTDAFEVRGGPGAGTEVRMTFAYDREADPADDNPITGGPDPSGRWQS